MQHSIVLSINSMVWLCSFHTINSNQHLDTYSITSHHSSFSVCHPPAFKLCTYEQNSNHINKNECMPTKSSSFNRLSSSHEHGLISLLFVLRESGIPHSSRPFFDWPPYTFAFKYQTFIQYSNYSYVKSTTNFCNAQIGPNIPKHGQIRKNMFFLFSVNYSTLFLLWNFITTLKKENKKTI